MSVAGLPRVAPGIVPVAPLKNTLVDNYEQWYTEPRTNNRMILSLRSGISSEVEWALNRLYSLFRLEATEQAYTVALNSLPGLYDALYQWPEWYAKEWTSQSADQSDVFAPSKDLRAKRSHALGSLWLLRHLSMSEAGSVEVLAHKRTLPLIASALENLDPHSDDNSEFLLHCIDLLQVVSQKLSLPMSFPTQTLRRIAGTSSDRSIIMSSLTALELIDVNPVQATRLDANSPALAGSLRYLPLFMDGPLVEAAVNYLYVHLSNPAMSKAFLLHPDMPSTLKVLVSYLLKHQHESQQTVEFPPPPTAPAFLVPTRDHELTKEELDELLTKAEPDRCFDWMKIMFIRNTQGELTQVDFWNLYKDTFQPFQDQCPLLIAADVIKNVNVVFPQAQAMVISGPTPRFVVRGVARTQDVTNERFKCRWLRGECSMKASSIPGAPALYEHVLSHLANSEEPEVSCLWANCPHPPLSRAALRSHLLTHLPSSSAPKAEPTQRETVTISHGEAHPTNNPTLRAPPPASDVRITWMAPQASEPPGTALTALLCIRILFRTTYASTDAAPRVDEDHFGFPGTVDDAEDIEVETLDDAAKEEEQKGCQSGKKAFVGISKLLECVNIHDDVLMSWILEMVDVASED